MSTKIDAQKPAYDPDEGELWYTCGNCERTDYFHFDELPDEVVVSCPHCETANRIESEGVDEICFEPEETDLGRPPVVSDEWSAEVDGVDDESSMYAAPWVTTVATVSEPLDDKVLSDINQIPPTFDHRYYDRVRDVLDKHGYEDAEIQRTDDEEGE